MPRHVFFSFKFDPDVFRANAIRNQSRLLGAITVGYWDNSLYERSLATNPEYIKSKIRDALDGTSVTVFLVTNYTKTSNYVRYEYDKSVERGNGILQLDVSNLEHPRLGKALFDGWLPFIDRGLTARWYHGCPLGDWIEQAA